jgi:hypothetical protein
VKPGAGTIILNDGTNISGLYCFGIIIYANTQASNVIIIKTNVNLEF